MAEIPQSLIDDWYTLKPIDPKPHCKPEIDVRTKRMLERSEKQRRLQEEEMTKRRAEREQKEQEMREIAERASEYSQVVAEAAKMVRSEPGQEDDWINYDVVDSELRGSSLHSVDTEKLAERAGPARDDHFGEMSTVDTFANYNFDHKYDPSLPMTENRGKVLKCIEENPVTIVTGPTGSGKTTQVPQYIMDKCAAEKRHCNIVCTQPRKIAATSIARRVCQERNWRIGSLVGYQVQMNRELSEDTRLMYVTTGVLLRKLVTHKHMNMYTHLIIDEVHERDQDTDFVMLVVRKFLRSNSQGVKVILMSATIESEMFAGYYSSVVGNRLVPAPVINVEGKIYPVVEFYSDDMMFLGEVPPQEYEKPDVDDFRIQLCGEIIRHFDLVEASNPRDEYFCVLDRGTVLVFLPGLAEITKVDNYLKQELKKHHLWIIPLHSSITIEEQRQAFVKPLPGQRKVILSTNIAESSITIPDIKYVIDFCLTKELQCDIETNYQALRINWASMASLTQRKGRAGRCSGGRCYRLISRKFKDMYIQEYAVPEMQRCPLGHLVLQAKLLDLGEPKLILGLAMQPPHLEDIEKTILCLKEVGALSTLKSGVANPYDGDLTFVGRVLATLPVDIHLGKLIILGHVFGCIEEAIIVVPFSIGQTRDWLKLNLDISFIPAAAFSMKSFFARPYRQELDAYKSKLSWGDYSHSDAIAALRAYREWWSLKESKAFGGSSRAEYKWCKQHMIQQSSIAEVANLIDELRARLFQFNLKAFLEQTRRQPNMSAEDLIVFKIVLAGAFYPNFFSCVYPNERIAVRDIGGRDPTTTVVVQGMPENGHLYHESLVRVFKTCGKGKQLHFDGSRVYIEFERPRPSHSEPPTDSSQPVLNAVYCALKMRQLRMQLVLDPPAHRQSSISSSKRWMSIPAESSGTHLQLQQIGLPSLGEIQLVITEVVDAGHFWAQLADDKSIKTHREFDITLNSLPGHSLKPLKPVNEGVLCLAKYSHDNQYYRAKIDSVSQTVAHVTFIDYGNSEQIPISSLRQIPSDFLHLPMQAFECFLANVHPSFRQAIGGNTWSAVANRRFVELTGNKILFGRIYSKVDDALRLEIIDTTDHHSDVNINDWLVQNGYAEAAPEPHNSKVARDLALRLQDAADRGEAAGLILPTEPTSQGLVSVVRPKTASDLKQQSASVKTTQVTVRGPFNPYEISFSHMACIGAGRGVRVERDSVNSIAIQEDPLSRHSRMMCAAQVTLTPSGETLLARNSTLLPHLKGLPELLVLLFAPSVELRTDQHRCHYTGCIAGLGYDPNTSQSLFPDHDLDMVFSANIDQDDMNRVNSIRMAINLAVSSEDKVSAWDAKAVRRIQNAAREKVVRLVTKDRRLYPVSSHVSNPSWNKIPAELLVPPDDHLETMEEDAPFFTLHCSIRLHREEDEPELDALQKRNIELEYHCKQMRSMASMSLGAIETFCRLCYVRCATPRALMYHLQSKAHRQEEDLLKQTLLN